MRIFKNGLNLLLLLFFTSFYSQVHDKSWRSITESRDENWFTTNEAKEIEQLTTLLRKTELESRVIHHQWRDECPIAKIAHLQLCARF